MSKYQTCVKLYDINKNLVLNQGRGPSVGVGRGVTKKLLIRETRSLGVCRRGRRLN